MLKNSKGVLVASEIVVFPIITFINNKKGFRCLGTGFFIEEHGGFITAKHVIVDSNNEPLKEIYGIQSLNDGTRLLRQLYFQDCHPKADIAHGMLGNVKNYDGSYSKPPIAETLAITLDDIKVNSDVKTYGYPIQEIEDAHMDTVTITFQGIPSVGEILQNCPDGSLITRNACYETSLTTQGGHSGGPVIYNDAVIGVNSSSTMDGNPSYFTPISFILDLKARDSDGTVLTFREVFERQKG